MSGEAPKPAETDGAIGGLIIALERQRELTRSVCQDWAEAHTHAQQAARACGVPDAQIEGDSMAVPGIEELIDLIAARVPKEDRP